MNNPSEQVAQPHSNKISINQYLVEFALHFKVVDVWSVGNGDKFLWIEDPSPAMEQILKVMSMWGGPTCSEHKEGKLRRAWEIHRDHVEWFRELIMRTACYREADTAQL